MKTLRIALFLILGSIVTLHSYAQEAKKEKKAIVKLEIVDSDGIKRVIDTSFTIAPDQEYAEIIRQLKEAAGFSKEEISKMKAELKSNMKDIKYNIDIVMDDDDRERLEEHMIIAREEMMNGKENLQKALEELQVELEGMKMNEEAMKKLEKAMEELHQFEMQEHTRHFDVLRENRDEDMDVFIMDGKHMKKTVWLNEDGEKEIHIETIINQKGDSVSWTSDKGEKLVLITEDIIGDDNTWTAKDGKKMKHSKGNTVFFGNDEDIEMIEEGDGEHKIIIRKIKGEAAKGDAMFISDDAHMVKEFKDEDGNVRVMRFESKPGALEEIHETSVMITKADEESLAKAVEKGILKANTAELMLNNFTIDVDNETISFGTTFEEKGKLDVKIFDLDMNQVWEKSFGKVSGEWSTVLPSDVVKEEGKYYMLFKQGKKVKLLLLDLN